MTNRIFEKDITPTMAEILGYQKCSKCDRQGYIRGTICVMCK